MVFETVESLESYFIEQAKNPNSFKDINIDDFRFNIAPIKIKLDGDDMESCIDTEMMARFLRLQDRIYDFVKISKYGSIKTKLTSEDILGFRLKVEVKSGCTELITDLSGVMENLISKMNGWQSLFALIAIVTGLSLYSIFKTKSDNKTKIELKKLENEALKSKDVEMVNVTRELITVTNNSLQLSSEVFQTLESTNAVISIDDEKLSKAELRRISRERNEMAEDTFDESENDEVYEAKSISGVFNVESVHLNRRNNCITLDLKDVFDGTTYRKVYLGYIGLNDKQMQLAVDALNGKELELELKMEKNVVSGKLKNGWIDGISEKDLFEDI